MIAFTVRRLLYGEGYSFGSLEDYWNYYRFAASIPAAPITPPPGCAPAAPK